MFIFFFSQSNNPCLSFQCSKCSKLKKRKRIKKKMLPFTCPNRQFHASLRGKQAEKEYILQKVLWLVYESKKSVCCTVCLHSDSVQDEFKENSTYEKVMFIWKTCIHKWITNKTSFSCFSTCSLCCITSTEKFPM